jgi:acetyltransferase-like isoleucine patch superfamily enzyme
MISGAARMLAWDWYPGAIPNNVIVDTTAYIETTYSFACCASREPTAVRIGKGASTYLGTMFDLGPSACVSIGDYTLVHGARIICDASIEIGDYTLISWNVVLMDTYRLPLDVDAKRAELRRVSRQAQRRIESTTDARPIRIGANVWIGFDACVLPGVRIGDGAIIGAKSVVASDVPAYSVAAGNPARIVRGLDAEEHVR